MPTKPSPHCKFNRAHLHELLPQKASPSACLTAILTVAQLSLALLSLLTSRPTPIPAAPPVRLSRSFPVLLQQPQNSLLPKHQKNQQVSIITQACRLTLQFPNLQVSLPLVFSSAELWRPLTDHPAAFSTCLVHILPLGWDLRKRNNPSGHQSPAKQEN